MIASPLGLAEFGNNDMIIKHKELHHFINVRVWVTGKGYGPHNFDYVVFLNHNIGSLSMEPMLVL